MSETPTPADVAAGNIKAEAIVTPAPEAPEPVATAPEAAPNIDGWESGETPELTVENASKVIAAIREDFKSKRDKLRDSVSQAAADEARTALTQELGKALGFVKDNEPVDPAALTAQLTSSQAEAKRARVELAVYRNAATAGADPLALLDSASFLAKVADLDPSDPAALTAAITSAIEANPRLGAAPTELPVMSPNPGQGTSGAGAPTPKSVQQQITDAEASGDWKTANALRANSLIELRKQQGA